VINKIDVNEWKISDMLVDKNDIEDLWMDTNFGKFVYYYARVRTESGATAWSSPVWMFPG
jgi:hypothetical protein